MHKPDQQVQVGDFVSTVTEVRARDQKKKLGTCLEYK